MVDVAGGEIGIQHLQRAAPGLPLAAQEGLDASRSPSRVSLLIACGSASFGRPAGMPRRRRVCGQFIESMSANASHGLNSALFLRRPPDACA
jgi:hypothetical protein